MPSRSFTSGRKFSTTTSAFATMRLKAARALRRFQIERHAALVAMQVLEVGAVARAARTLALLQMRRRLDLDDVGAPVGELAHAGRPRAHAREIENGEAGKGLGCPGKRHFDAPNGLEWPELRFRARHSPI